MRKDEWQYFEDYLKYGKYWSKEIRRSKTEGDISDQLKMEGFFRKELRVTPGQW